MRSLFVIAFILMCLQSAEAIEPPPSGQLQLNLEKLNTLSSVLYVAAHPDDENTKLLTYLANEAQAHTTYLSLTRGDGGQNLLGADLGEKLGVVRTQELLAARRLDGAAQRFSRAIDFGYSKTPDETLEIWGKEAILADLVWAIRSTRPDVIVTRFADEPGHTHGHHTAATWLAKEALTAAADPERFPEQLDAVEPWAAKRLIWNTSPWFYLRREIAFDPTGLLAVDVGGYNPLLGASYPEIAARSRSSHKTQGFGATPEQGESMEYFVHLAGEPATASLFSGIDTTWGRISGAAPVAAAIDDAIEAFSPLDPDRSVSHLIRAHRILSGLPDQFWKARKLHDLEQVIAGCLALDVESVSERPSGVPGSDVRLTFNAIQRSGLDVTVQFAPGFETDFEAELVSLEPNQLAQTTRSVRLPDGIGISQPYWLMEPSKTGRYAVSDRLQIGTPENPPALPVRVDLTVDGYPLTYTIPTRFNYNDPVRGEVKVPFAVTPPAMVQLPESPMIFSDSSPKTFTARIIVKSNIVDGDLHFEIEDGWRVAPDSIKFDAEAGDELELEATLTPPPGAGQATLRAALHVDGEVHRRGYERLEYDHIPTQTLFPPAEARVVLLDVAISGERIGYIPGAGDAIPEALQRIGYRVDSLAEAEMQPGTLTRYDAIVLGVRALNTNNRIEFYMPALFEYAAAGGVVILQYNTDRNLKTDVFSPYAITLSRDRVTDETAELRVLAPDHPVLNHPNRIAPTDFEDWVQERGLYFASKWSPEYTPIFAVNDPDEAPSEGSLLIARHGDGWFVYSGLSWFRQLPAGVPGAYRLFANLVSLGGRTD